MKKSRTLTLVLLLAAGVGTACNGGSLYFAGSTGTPSGTGSPTPTGSNQPTPTPTNALVPGQLSTGSSGGATSSSISASFPTLTQASNLIAVAVGWTGTGVPSVTDASNGSYTPSAAGVSADISQRNVEI